MMNKELIKLWSEDLAADEEVPTIKLYVGSDYVLTGVTALQYHGLTKANPYNVEVETDTCKTKQTRSGVCYINSGYIDTQKVYDEETKLWYTSLGKAVVDALHYCTDTKALETAIYNLHVKGLTTEVLLYTTGQTSDDLVSSWHRSNDWFKFRNEAMYNNLLLKTDTETTQEDVYKVFKELEHTNRLQEVENYMLTKGVEALEKWQALQKHYLNPQE